MINLGFFLRFFVNQTPGPHTPGHHMITHLVITHLWSSETFSENLLQIYC